MRRNLLWCWCFVIVVSSSQNECALAQVPPARIPTDVASGGLVELALRAEVLKELGLDKDSPQVTEIKKLSETQKKDLLDAFQKQAIEGGDIRAIRPKIYGKINADLEKVLKPEQYTRLQQIQWQQLGRRAVLEDDIAKALKLTDEQRKKLSDAHAEYRKDSIESYRRRGTDRPADPADTVKAPRDLNQTVDRKIDEILTAEQRVQLIELKGRPFRLTFTEFTPSERRPAITIQPGGLMELALQQPVLTELGIKSDGPEVAQLQRLAKELREALAKKLMEINGRDRKAIAEALAGVHASFYPELQKVLTPEQYKRLRQIGWQRQGNSAFSDPELIKILDIKPEQQEKIAAAESDYQSQFREMLRSTSTPGRFNPEAAKKMQELQAVRNQKTEAALTKEQQDKLAELKGKPFSLGRFPRPNAPPQPDNREPEEKAPEKN